MSNYEGVFRYGDEILRVVKSFNCLGVEFRKISNFAKGKKNSFDRPQTPSIFGLIQTARDRVANTCHS